MEKWKGLIVICDTRQDLVEMFAGIDLPFPFHRNFPSHLVLISLISAYSWASYAFSFHWVILFCCVMKNTTEWNVLRSFLCCRQKFNYSRILTFPVLLFLTAAEWQTTSCLNPGGGRTWAWSKLTTWSKIGYCGRGCLGVVIEWKVVGFALQQRVVKLMSGLDLDRVKQITQFR